MRKATDVCPFRLGNGEVGTGNVYAKDGALAAQCADDDYATMIVSWSRVAPELGRLMRTLQEYEDGLIDRIAAFERMRSVLVDL